MTDIEDKRLWTFVVRGGEPLKLQPKGNIPDEHDGGLSILKFVLTEQRAEETRALLEQHGCTVQVNTERQSDEQKKLRQQLAGVMREDAVFPCAECPGCSFFDPHSESYCGADDWPQESVVKLLEIQEKARNNLAQCPLEKGRNYL